MITVIDNKIGKNIRFSLYQNDSWKVQFLFTDLDGKEVDLTGAEVVLWIKKASTSKSPDFEFLTADLTIEGNSIKITKHPEWSRSRYYYELQITLSNAFRFTAAYGYISVQQSTIITNSELTGTSSIDYQQVPVQLKLRGETSMNTFDTLYYVATGNENGLQTSLIPVNALKDKKVVALDRAAPLYPTDDAIPDEQHFRFDSSTGTITLAASTPLKAGETIRIFYTNN